VVEATQRAESYVDSTVNLSNLPMLSTFVLGASSSPTAATVSSSFAKQVAGPLFERLKRSVQEHTQWLAANCEGQTSSYSHFIDQLQVREVGGMSEQPQEAWHG
jgi:hypothetical protein